MKNIFLSILLVTTFNLLLSQDNGKLHQRIKTFVKDEAKVSDQEYNLYGKLFDYQDFINELEENKTTFGSDQKRKLSSMSASTKEALKTYKKTYDSEDLTTKMLRKKHYNVHVSKAESLIEQLDKKTETFKNNGGDVFAKQVSAFIHKYDALINYNPRAYLANSKFSTLSNFSKEREELNEQYQASKNSIADEFKMANEQGIIDYYSKQKKYSEVFEQINNIHKNTALKESLVKGINVYSKQINTFYNEYGLLLPEYFIKWGEKANENSLFYTSIGFKLEDKEFADYQEAIKKSDASKTYLKSDKYKTYAKAKNKNIMEYTYVDETNGEVTFKKYTFTSTKAPSALINSIKKENKIFEENSSNYEIIKVVPISEKYSKNYVGVWKDIESGIAVDKAYSYYQDFIITYKDKSSNDCFAMNAKVKFIDDYYFVSSKDIKYSHERLIPCN